MGTNSIPDVVQRLIREHIDSVEQLEVLLLLRREPARAWCADSVARELRIAPASAGERLADLCRRGMLAPAADAEAPASYRYAPGEKWLDDAVGALAAAYAERRVSVINLIFSKPTERTRTFADAFRVWRN